MATVRTVLVRGEKRFQVDLGEDIHGKRIRFLVENEEAGESAVKKFEKAKSRGDAWWATRSQKEKAVIAAVCAEVASSGFTLLEVWEGFKKGNEEQKDKKTVVIEFDKAVAEWKRLKRGTGDTDEYLDGCERFFLRFAEGREKKAFNSFNFTDIQALETANKDWSIGTKKGYRRLFSSLWETGIRQGWDTKNIIDRLEPLPRTTPNISIYSNLEIKRMFAGAMMSTITQKVVPLFTLGTFGCMRPEEITEPPENPKSKPFGWWVIDMENGLIPLTEDLTKTSEVRTIVMQKTCKLWLEWCKEHDCEIPPANHRKLREMVFDLIGLKWKKDGLRKTCATHLRGRLKNDYKVIEQMGNKIRILLRHYAKLNVPETVSNEFWDDLTPEAIEKYMKSREWKEFISGRSATLRRSASESAKGAS